MTAQLIDGTALAEYDSAEEWDYELLRQELLMHYLLQVPELEDEALRVGEKAVAQLARGFHDEAAPFAPGAFSGLIVGALLNRRGQ